MLEPATHRPRNVGWARAAALLYGDWGTSKAYVIGLAFVAAGFSSFPIILAVCGLTGLVGYNYIIICRHFPDGGGVYSAAREQSRVLAVLGSLLLLADFIVTAAMSCWDAMSYFHIPSEYLKFATIGFIFLVGAINFFGPKHSGSFAVTLAIPMVVVVISIVAFSLPHLSFHPNLLHPAGGLRSNWVKFVEVILALSGVEAIANLTGVMKLDRGATPEHPSVAGTAKKAIFPVAIEVVFGTALLGWAMLSLPTSMSGEIKSRYEDMLRFLGEHYGGAALGEHFGHLFGIAIGWVVGLLLLSAVNTAVGAMIGLIYMLARDREMPREFTRLNSHGVPWQALLVAVVLPAILVILSENLDSLADMYAIGVVGAITVNLGSSCFNKRLGLNWREFSIMLVTFIILFCVEITIAKTKPAALFFAACVLGVGFGMRWYALKRAGFETVTLTREQAAAVTKPELLAPLRPNFEPGQAILVAARGFTPLLKFALEEAKLRQGNLYVLYIKQLSVALPGPITNLERPRWQNDREAATIMYGTLDLAREAAVSVLPVFAVSENPAGTIVDIAATLGVDILMLGAPHRNALAKLLRGDVVTEVARSLPENIQLVIHG
ncbi:MAG TPA: universal stress protein [Verrucomicrobiae bacterium]|jgi:amino acid transporter/nucleotide-binding universal stress UspA family protein|nr:universal stress protein [Verrucomicrobiae bacterium]